MASVRKINDARLAFYRAKGREPGIPTDEIGRILDVLDWSGRVFDPEHYVAALVGAEKHAGFKKADAIPGDKVAISALFQAFVSYLAMAPIGQKASVAVARSTEAEMKLRRSIAELGLNTYIDWDK